MEEKKASSSMAAELEVSKQSTTTSQNHRRGPPILPGEIRQLFSLPDSIIYYIAMHPSNAEVYKKLIRTCKYFYNQNPILVVYSLNFDVGSLEETKSQVTEDSSKEEDSTENSSEDDASKDDASKDDANEDDESEDNESENDASEDDASEDDTSEDDTSEDRSDEIDYFEHIWNVEFKESHGQPIDMDMVPCKFWVIDCIAVCPEDTMHQTATNFIVPRIYRSDAAVIELNEQTLTLDELLILGSNSTKFWFHNVKITENDNGKTEVMFEKVIERFPKLQEICWRIYIENQNISCISRNTASELVKIPHFSNITKFMLLSPYETFDTKVLFDYLKTCNKNMEVDLEYDGVFSAQFMQEIDQILDEIIATQVFTYKPPYINYTYSDKNKFNQICKIQNRYRNTRF